MFFSGDPSTRKRVDLGGRSSKERDRKKLLEQTRLERNRRLFQRQQNSAAIKIQKCFRGRRVMKAEHQKVREQFFMTYGTECEKVDRYCFGPDSEFLRQLLFFYNTQRAGDFFALVKTCQFLQQSVRDTGDIVSLFSGGDYSSSQSLVDYRVTQLAYTCILAVHANRNQLNELISVTSSWRSDSPLAILLRTANMLMDRTFPWSCKIVGYLTQRNTFPLMREIVLAWKGKKESQLTHEELSILERVVILIVSHVIDTSCICQDVDPQWSFTSQILTIPFIWQIFPYVKEALGRQEVSKYYIHQMAHCMQNHSKFLPNDMTPDFPSFACLLGNVLEVASIALSQTETSFDMVVDFTAVATFLLELLPPLKPLRGQNKENMEDEEMITADGYGIHFLNEDLQRQISNAIDPRFLLQLINVLFGGLVAADSDPDDKVAAAVSAACAFLHVTFNTLPLERVMTVLAYRTGLVPILWNFMRWCHENNKWSVLSEHSAYLPEGAPGWLLPLVVFCPVYKHMLMIVDNEEFYEREKPLSLKDIRFLIVILRQALWQLLWINPSTLANLVKNNPEGTTDKILSLDLLQQRVSSGASELLSQLQDWNNRRQFAPASDFHADGVTDYFISQAMQESTRAREILKQAPFLVPFTSRVKIFTSQLAAARQRDGAHSAVFGRNRFRIRRDHILEDAFNQLNALSDEDLRGVMRVTFINEFGVEEAGIDGGGIFKDFMENITRSAFDIQYGLFKETADHLLYPNPGSGLVHEQHLQFFHFLGTILAKAMFEGILVDIPFATFFLSKLKQKHNYLNDLPSLDPELYRHLIFLKHYDRDISELELYFVIVNNEYGEQTEEELLPGGKHMRVTNENVITFIHLVANYRLNYQIRQQSSHFLRGFEQLIRKEWIDMFNEHELQMLISGSLEGLDIDDLRSHSQYSGGYHADHYVIEMFWEVIKGMSQENQKKFLKFVTGCSRGPLLGFKYLEPQFCIQRAGGSATEETLDRLPTAATCMNLLKLPPYQRKEQLERKLMYAISADAGFDLS
ncbi:E3 ubiquitin-protein ligase UPL6-like protein [Drosera capensis]